MAARKRKLTLDAGWRSKIQASQIANRLEKCFNGEVELNATQLKAGMALFNKLEPDLNRTDIQPLNEQGEKSSGFNINIKHVK